jgi:hypothetical protein
VHVTRCLVRGGLATQNGDGIRVASGTDILTEDTEVAIANPSAYLDGIAGSNMTVRRANIHGGVDGMKLGSNDEVECRYIHDEVSFSSDPNQGAVRQHFDHPLVDLSPIVRCRHLNSLFTTPPARWGSSVLRSHRLTPPSFRYGAEVQRGRTIRRAIARRMSHSVTRSSARLWRLRCMDEARRDGHPMS